MELTNILSSKSIEENRKFPFFCNFFLRFLLSMLFILFITELNCGDWDVRIVDSADEGSFFPSLALDSYENPHISYGVRTPQNGGNWVLKYAKWDGFSWKIQTVDAEGSVGFYSCIAIDSNNYPHIAYIQFSNEPWIYNSLKYARWDGISWSTHTVDSYLSYSGDSVSIVLDKNNYPHIAYLGAWGLTYAKWTGLSWIIEKNISGGLIKSINLKLDNKNIPHIAYWFGGEINGTKIEQIRYAKKSSTGWNIQIIDSVGEKDDPVYSSRDVSMVLDNRGHPHICYEGGEGYSRSLKYAKWTGQNWEIQTIDSFGVYPSISIDRNNYPHISFYGSGGLKYAKWTGGGWFIELVDSVIVRRTSLVLDSKGYPHISYRDMSNEMLKYAKRKSIVGIVNVNVESGEVLIQGGSKGYVNPREQEQALIILRPRFSGSVKIKIYTLRGELVWQNDLEVTEGIPRVTNWPCRNLDNEIVASGIYVIHVKGVGIDTKKKVAIVK